MVMSKSVTVNFADGTTHVYDDVPDEVSNDEVNQRAQQDFSKPIQAVGAQQRIITILICQINLEVLLPPDQILLDKH